MANNAKYDGKNRVNKNITELKFYGSIFIYKRWELEDIRDELELQEIEYIENDCTDYWEVRLV